MIFFAFDIPIGELRKGYAKMHFKAYVYFVYQRGDDDNVTIFV